MYVIYFIAYNNNFSHTHTSNSVSSSFKTYPESEYLLSLVKPLPGPQHHLTHQAIAMASSLVFPLPTCPPPASAAPHCIGGTDTEGGGVRATLWPVHFTACRGPCTLHSLEPPWLSMCENGVCLCIPVCPFPQGLGVPWLRAQLLCSGSVAWGKLPNLSVPLLTPL